MGRLTEANESAATAGSYSYDHNGNRLSDNEREYAYNTDNQIVTIDDGTSSLEPRYDDRGNYLELPGVTAEDFRFTYTLGDHMGFWNEAGGDEYRQVYGDDTNTNRVVSERPGEQRYELRPDHGLTAIDVNAGGTSTRQTITRLPDGQPIAVSTDGATQSYLISDHQGSTTATLTSTGAVDTRYAYDPYGQPRATINPLVGYATGQTDPNGLIKFGARYYQPTHGIFTQMDPSGQEDNPYLYATGDPINTIDPTGLLSCDVEGVVSGLASWAGVGAAAFGFGGALIGGMAGGLPGAGLGAGVGAAIGGGLGLAGGAGYYAGACLG